MPSSLEAILESRGADVQAHADVGSEGVGDLGFRAGFSVVWDLGVQASGVQQGVLASRLSCV